MDEQKRETVQEGIDIIQILQNCLRTARRWWLLIPILAVLLGGYQYCRTSRDYRPVYTASATFSVSSGVDNTTDLVSGSSYYDVQAARQVVDSFPYIIGSEAMTERIMETLGTGYINGYVNTPQVIGDSNFYVLSATSPDPQTALDLLNAVIENYPQVASFVVGNTRLSMIKEPALPTVPSNAFDGPCIALKGAAIGVVLACGIIFLVSLGRSTVQKPEDLQAEVSLRCLGEIPEVQLRKRRRKASAGVSLLNSSAKGQMADTFSSIRVKLLRELEKSDDRMILVTSTLPGEGKTTVSFNLALSLAQSGRSVILVDADLRNQSIKERFGITEKSKGLAELLQEPNADPMDALLPLKGTGLRILAGDTRIPRAMDLVDSPRMRQLLQKLRGMADYIVIDAPPSGILGDAAVLGRRADKTLYVVRYDAVPRRQIVDSILGLSRRNVPMCGYVINGREHSMGGSGYGYGKYGYGYGYGKSGYGHSTEKRRR